MIPMAMVSPVLIATLIAQAGVAAGTSAGAPQSQVTAEEAAPFIGEWILKLEGPNGPGTFELTIKVEKEKVAGEIATETMATQKISEVSKADTSLVLGYSFEYEGSPVSAVVSLTPAADGKMNAQISFADGAYVMSGTATKKENKGIGPSDW